MTMTESERAESNGHVRRTGAKSWHVNLDLADPGQL